MIAMRTGVPKTCLSGFLALLIWLSAVPSLAALRERCTAARAALHDTRFDVADYGDCIAVICPWGNSFACYEATAAAAAVALGGHPR